MSRRSEGNLFYDAERREMQARDRDMIPRGALLGMAALVLSALGVTTYASVTDRPLSGVAAPSPVVETAEVILVDKGAALTATAPDGRVLVDLENGAFLTVVNTALKRKRVVTGVDGNPPMTLSRLEDGRLILNDPASDWRADLTSYAATKTAAWDQLFAR